jgi:hypothetical protein
MGGKKPENRSFNANEILFEKEHFSFASKPVYTGTG